MGLRVQSNLPSELEDLVRDTIDSCFDVHVDLGPGWLEGVYLRAVCLELDARKIPYEAEKLIPIKYRGTLLCHHRLDLFIDQQLVLELKAVERIHSIHIAQVISYLRASQSRIGLLINFNVPVFKQGVRRVVL
jgi:GxxExxY protein